MSKGQKQLLRDPPHTWPPSRDWFPLVWEFGGLTAKAGDGGMGADGAKGPSGHWSTKSEPEPLNPLIHRYPLGRGIPSSLPNAASPHPSFWKGSSDLSDVLSERLSEVPAPPVEGSKAMELRWPPSLEPTEETRKRGSILRPPNGQTHQWSPRRQKLFPVIWVLLGALTVPGRRVSIQRENRQARTHTPTGG